MAKQITKLLLLAALLFIAQAAWSEQALNDEVK